MDAWLIRVLSTDSIRPACVVQARPMSIVSR